MDQVNGQSVLRCFYCSSLLLLTRKEDWIKYLESIWKIQGNKIPFSPLCFVAAIKALPKPFFKLLSMRFEVHTEDEEPMTHSVPYPLHICVTNQWINNRWQRENEIIKECRRLWVHVEMGRHSCNSSGRKKQQNLLILSVRQIIGRNHWRHESLLFGESHSNIIKFRCCILIIRFVVIVSLRNPVISTLMWLTLKAHSKVCCILISYAFYRSNI